MNNERMVERLVKAGALRTPAVIEAMRAVDRKEFVPGGWGAYADSPQHIGYGQTISAPHMVAIMTEALRLGQGMKVLEIGTGSGYQAAIIAKIVDPGIVYTVERVSQLREFAEENIRRMAIENVRLFVGDGSCGLPEYAPYDRIIVTCAAPSAPPPLKEQLKDGGMLLIPIGPLGYQDLMEITRIGDRFEERNLGGCVFVPLRGEFGYR